MTGADRPNLSVHAPAGPVGGVVLVLHGGQASSMRPVRPWSLAGARMRPIAWQLRRSGAGDGLAVAWLRYRVRGWNGSAQSPVADAEWALDELSRRFDGTPIGLVGHSMGGRTALYVAGHAQVLSVVALAPWIEPGDPEEPMRGRRLLIVHGPRDRITDPRASAEFAARVRPRADQVSYISVRGGGHGMLRRPRLWHDLAVGFTVGALLNTAPAGTARSPGANAVADALAGAPSLVV